jgi:proline iminopeptidase
MKIGILKVRDGAEIYWESAGNPEGTPALFLHGGPGGGFSEGHRKHFDLDKYFVVAFDQRGCGRSKPLVSVENLESNTTQALIEDIEELREFLKIKKWVILGISWGTCLGLSYALKHPSKVQKLVLAAIHIPTKKVVSWITEELSLVFPDEWDSLAKAVDWAPGKSLIDLCYQKITSSNEDLRKKMAEAWCKWEDVHMSLDPSYRPFEKFEDPKFREIFATLVIHYWKHHAFLNELEFFEELERLKDISVTMIHGRLDISSPLRIANEISKKLPLSKLIVVKDEGHGGVKIGNEITRDLNI